jgi:teichuronic acid exporter
LDVPGIPTSQRPLHSEKRLIRKGVAWNAVGMGVAKGSSILAKLVLARFLLPEHFGFISMVVVFTSVTKILADLGFRLSLIQRQRDYRSRLLYDSAFWLLLVTAVVMIGAMALVGVPLLVWFYGEPRLGSVALAMSAVVLFQNLQVVPEARLARLMRFRQIAYGDIIGTLTGSASAILLAIAGAGVWSLVAQTLVSAACTSMVLFALSGWRPRWRMDLPILRSLASYSRFIIGTRTLISVQQNLDYLLIGKLIGAEALGIYSIAFLLTETLRSQAYWLVSKAVFPFYSRAIGRHGDIRSVYLGTVRYMTVTVFPAAMVLILFAHQIVPALFPPRWHAAIEPMQILAVASMVVASGGTPSEVLRGIGRPDVDFRLNLGVAVLAALPALWIGIAWMGLPGAAFAVIAYSSIARIAYGVMLHRLIGLPTMALARALRQASIGCVAMGIVKLLFGDSHWILAALVAAIAYGLVVLPMILPFLSASRGATGAEVAVEVGATSPS